MLQARTLAIAMILMGLAVSAVSAQVPSASPRARVRVTQDEAPTLRRVGENVRQERTATRDGQMRETVENRLSGEPEAARCAAVTAAIDARLKRYTEQKEAHIAVHQRIHDRLQALIERLAAKGYDVTVVKADLVKLDELIKQANDDYQVFIIKLEMTKRYNCGTAEGDFKAKLAEAKAALAVFRADVKAIVAFVKDTLKPHVRELRVQVQSSNDNNGGER